MLRTRLNSSLAAEVQDANVIHPRPGRPVPLKGCAPRGLGTVLAAVMAMTPLLGTLHDASVRHVACPDDGELIDAPAQPAHRHARTTAERAFFPEAPLGPSALGTDHDHCVVALHLRGNLGVSPSQPAAAVVSDGGPPRVEWRGTAGAPGLLLYRLAPKASPPRQYVA